MPFTADVYLEMLTLCAGMCNVTQNILTRARKVAFIESSVCFLCYTKALTSLSYIVKYDIYIYIM